MDFIQGELESFPAKHNLVIEDISLFLFSQFSYKNISLIRDHFGLPDDKIPLVRYDIGYTGASSPFVALHDLSGKDILSTEVNTCLYGRLELVISQV